MTGANARRWASNALPMAGASVLGLVVILAPLWAGVTGPAAWLWITVIVALAVAVLLLDAGVGLDAKAVGVLGALVAANSALRLAETVVPGPGGFSPIFALVVLGGFRLGPRVGFLIGSLSLGVSALITGGGGPWLPHQMLAAGWVGLTAGLLPGAGLRRAHRPPGARVRWGLAVFGAIWGFAYGWLLSIFGWLWLETAAPGQGALSRYAAFYVTTSLPWDVFRAGGNALLILLLARPMLAALGRVGRRMTAIIETDGDRPTRTGGGPLTGPPRLPDPDGERGRPAEDSAGSRAGGVLPGHAVRPAAWTWVVWLVAITAVLSLTRNLAALAIVGLAVTAVRTGTAGRAAKEPHARRLPVGRIAVVIVSLSTLYYALLVEIGERVVWRLPEVTWFPTLRIGGPITLEAMMLGLGAGLALALMVVAFDTAQSVLSPRDVVRLAPRAYHTPALAAGVALAWLPAMRRSWDAAAEARALRGLAGRGPRAWWALVTPVMLGAVERSERLAESLSARGVLADHEPSKRVRGAMLAGLLLATVALLVPMTAAWSLGLVAAGALIMAGSVRLASGPADPNIVRQDDARRPPAADVLTALGALVPVGALLLLPSGRALADPTAALAGGSGTLLPSLDPLLALALAMLVAPAVAHRSSRGSATEVRWDEGVARASEDPSRRGDAGSPEVSALDHPRGVADRRMPAPTDPIAMIQWRDVWFRYPPGDTAEAPWVLQAADQDLPRGVALIAGPSGAGKSTLLRTVNGLVPRFTGGHFRGAIRVGPHDLDPIRERPRGMSDVVGFVGGDPERQLVADTVLDEVMWPLLRHRDRRAAGRTALRCLDRVGLAGYEHRTVRTLSGGELQRLAIAAALVTDPPVLVLDEPTSQLDAASAAAVWEVVAEHARRGGWAATAR